MVVPVIMGIVPEDVSYPAGTPVWGTDYNAAYSLLLRWWGLLEAPGGVDCTPMWENLVADDIVITASGLTAKGITEARQAVARARAEWEWSFELGFEAMSLTWLGHGRFQLDAQFVEQRRAGAGATTARTCTWQARLRKQNDGRLVFIAIEEQSARAALLSEFVSHYVVNRAKATMIQFQTHTDLLTGDAEPMRELLMPALELHGLVNSQKDETRGDETTFTDVRNLRETISTSARRQDNIIRTHAEFAAWFASCTALFRKDGFHKLERFEVIPLLHRRYRVVAQFNWRAETINGAAIDLHTPLTWILADTDDKYMRIEKLLPFG